MACGGGFAPLPIRHGGNGLQDGWTAAQVSRFTADLVACKRTVPFATLRISYDSASDTATVVNYEGANGEGLAKAPTLSGTGGVWTITFPVTFRDDYQNLHTWYIDHAGADGNSSSFAECTVDITDANTLDLYAWDDTGAALTSDWEATVSVWRLENVSIADYGGSLNKRDSQFEGAIPYASTMYRELTAALGSAYTRDTTGWVHLQKLATARQLGFAFYRLAEKNEAESSPATASSKLDYWEEVLDLLRNNLDSDSTVRAKGSARYVANDNSHVGLETILRKMLGNVFVRMWQIRGTDQLNQPLLGFYPGGTNAGPEYWDLGGGTWSNEVTHMHLQVQLTPLVSSPEALSSLMDSAVFEELDRRAPAWCTWDWSHASGEDGFAINESELGFDSLGES